MATDTQRMMLYQANQKSTAAAYLLWFFLGFLGAHRFYAGRTGSGVAMLLLWVVSFALTFIAIGVFGFVALGLWWLVDGFLVAGWIRNHNMLLAAGLGA